MLCRAIPFFGNMISEGAGECAIKTAEFIDDSPAAFDLLLEWVYTGHLRILDRETKLQIPARIPILVYGLAEKLRLYDLTDAIMDMVIEAQRKGGLFSRLENVEEAYKVTQAGCSMRRYLASTAAFMMFKAAPNDEAWSVANINKAIAATEDFGNDVLNLLRNNSSGKDFPDPRNAPPCAFHNHDIKKVCKRIAEQGGRRRF